MREVLCFGNPYLDIDNSVFRVIKGLKAEGFKFIKCGFFTELLKHAEDGREELKELIILDTVKGITKPIVITDLDKLKNNRPVSLHDFDLAFNLKLLKETGRIKGIRIIGIPESGNTEDIKKRVLALLRSI